MKNRKLYLGLVLMCSLHAGAQSLYPGVAEDKIVKNIDDKVQLLSFDLSEVRLHEGVLYNAMQANRKWLLDLSPDRFLCRFYEYAGLPAKAPIYGGWESQGVSGHTLGHYLSACAMQYAATGDEEFKSRVDYMVSELARCQKMYKGLMAGYVGGIPEQERIFTEIYEGKVYSSGFDLNGGWVPIYTLHKLYAGLVDAYLYCNNEEAKDVVTKCADWLINITSNLDEAKFQQMISCEIGGMNEVLDAIYILTGEQKYLDIAKKFYHKAVLDPMVEGLDQLNGLHANTQIPKVLGCLTEYLATGEEDRYKLAAFFWDRVVHHHTYSMGGNSDSEHFGEPDHLYHRRTSGSAETCNTYNMLKLTKKLFQIDADAEMMDYYERALYNHILASQNPATGMVCYYVNLQNGLGKAFSTPFDSFWCCVASGLENHTKYTETIYMHDKSDNLYVNLFIPSELNWKEKGLRLIQTTGYPYEQGTRLELAEGAGRFSLWLRHPSWAVSGFDITVNGEKVQTSENPGSYVEISREWKTGDVIEVKMPFSFHTMATPDNENCRTIFYGPVALAANMAKQSVTFTDIPVIVKDGDLGEGDFVAENDSLHFVTSGIGQLEEAKLIPFFEANNSPYALYMDFFTQQRWEEEKDRYYEELNREQELKARTTDELRHEMQSERDHNLKSMNSRSGNNNGILWRDAVDGGWYSFDLSTQRDTTVQLYVKYWGSDGDSWRKFDIMVDGITIMTQTLSTPWFPNEEYEAIYDIPVALLKGKDKITVKFQAHQSCSAGGTLGCRLIKRSEKDQFIYANTIDEIKPGNEQSENKHQYKGSEGTHSGFFINKYYRDASGESEKWITYRMKVYPDHKNQLVCEYYGGENYGTREFDIMIDGEKIATEIVQHGYLPKRFYFVSHDIPENLTVGKKEVEVKFITGPNKYIGGLFGLRMVSVPNPDHVGQVTEGDREEYFFDMPFDKSPLANSEVKIYSFSGTCLLTCKGQDVSKDTIKNQLKGERTFLYKITGEDFNYSGKCMLK